MRDSALERMANKEQSMKTCAKHDDWLMAQLADAEFAAEYLNAASEDDDPAIYLVALRKVVEARGGIAVVAEKPICRVKRCIARCRRGISTIRTLNAVLRRRARFGVSERAEEITIMGTDPDYSHWAMSARPPGPQTLRATRQTVADVGPPGPGESIVPGQPLH